MAATSDMTITANITTKPDTAVKPAVTDTPDITKAPNITSKSKDLAITQLIEALLTESFQYPKTDAEKLACAEGIQKILDSNSGLISVTDIFNIPGRSGKTVIEMVMATDNEHASSTFIKFACSLAEQDEVSKNLVHKLFARKEKKQQHEERYEAELEQWTIDLKSQADMQDTLLKALTKPPFEYLQLLKEKTEENEAKIKNKFSKILETSGIEYDIKTAGYFRELILNALQGTVRLMDIYPGVLQHLHLIKQRNKALPKLLKNLPDTIKKSTEDALNLNKTDKLILKLKDFLEKYDPQYCATYKRYLSGKPKMSSPPPELLMLGHNTLGEMNEVYLADINAYLDAQFKLIDQKFSQLFVGCKNTSLSKKDLLLPIQLILDRGHWAERKNKPYGFGLVNDAYNYAEMMVEGYHSLIDMVSTQWLESNKKASISTLMETAVSSFNDSFNEQVSQAEVLARDRKTQKLLDSKKREEAARLRAIEEKQLAETQTNAFEATKKAVELKAERETILQSLPQLNKDQRTHLVQIIRLGRSLHNLLDTEVFCEIAKKLPPFSIENADKGYQLFYNKKFITTLHREHGGKKLNGEVLAKFVDKLNELRLVPELLKEIRNIEQTKVAKSLRAIPS